MEKEVSEQERQIATQLLMNEIVSLRTKIDVLAEPYIEAKTRFNSFIERITPIINDYQKLRQETERLQKVNAELNKKLEKYEPKKEDIKNEGGENKS